MDRFEARLAECGRRCARRAGSSRRSARTGTVGHSSRAPHEPIEPRLSLQWFVKVGPLAQAAGDAVRDGRVVVHPKELEPRWFAWVDNMYDWCISRQLWWGHRIPVWYGPAGEVVCLGPDEEPPAGWTQDDDVLAPVLLRAVAVLHARLAGRFRTCGASTRRRCWSPATTSCSSSPG
jgi:valyl-tRNA synthetase